MVLFFGIRLTKENTRHRIEKKGGIKMIKVIVKPTEFRNARIVAGLTGAALARMLGVDKTAIYNYEKGVNGVSPQYAKKISDILNVEMDSIFNIIEG